VSFATPDQLNWRSPAIAKTRDEFEKLNDAGKTAKAAPSGPPQDEHAALQYLERIAMDARASAREIQDAAGGSPAARDRIQQRVGGRARGGQLSQQLTMVRRMIAARLNTKVYYVSMGGYDTHAGQPNRHQQLLGQLGDAISGFIKGLKDDGTLGRVLLMTFSEFGRRVAENASQGTDHGAAAPLFIAGSHVTPGIHGAHPSLEPGKLDRGDLKWQIDFRGVYTGILTQWLKADAAKVLGGKFEAIRVLNM